MAGNHDQRIEDVTQDSPAKKQPIRVRSTPAAGNTGSVLGARINAVLRQYLPADWAVSAYLALTGLAVVIWGRGSANQWEIVLSHLGLIVLVFILVRFLHHVESRTGRFVRVLYLPVTMTYFYEETSMLIHLFEQGWFDHQIIALEQAILGGAPTLLIQPWQTPLLNEWMMLGYFSYYFLVGAVPLVLFIKDREREAAQVVWAQSLAFFISYLGFIMYPIQGPRYEFAGLYEQPLTGYVFVPLVHKIIKTAAIHGGCMPSSHVAAALVSLVYLCKSIPRVGFVCIPLVVTLCLATVYGRFHYASDVVVGLLVGIIALIIARRFPVKDSLLPNRRPPVVSRGVSKP